MSNFSVIVDSNSASFRKQLRVGGNILCNFHIRLDERPFPSDPWLDFPVIVLTWWLDGYTVMQKTGEPVENAFMNGPFEFVTALEGENIIITCRRRGLKKSVEVGAPFAIGADRYKHALVQAAGVLTAELSNISVKSSDVRNLEAALAKALSS